MLFNSCAADVGGLRQVLENRAGIPITLALVYMEVAARAGFEVVGLNMPGAHAAPILASSKPPVLSACRRPWQQLPLCTRDGRLV